MYSEWACFDMVKCMPDMLLAPFVPARLGSLPASATLCAVSEVQACLAGMIASLAGLHSCRNVS